MTPKKSRSELEVMSELVRNFLRNEERASRIVMESAVILAVVGFVIAVSAMLLMK